MRRNIPWGEIEETSSACGCTSWPEGRPLLIAVDVTNSGLGCLHDHTWPDCGGTLLLDGTEGHPYCPGRVATAHLPDSSCNRQGPRDYRPAGYSNGSSASPPQASRQLVKWRVPLPANRNTCSKAQQREFLSLHNNHHGKQPFSGLVQSNALLLGLGPVSAEYSPVISKNVWGGEI